MGGVVLDGAGNLYGTTTNFGKFNYGNVFELKAGGSFKILHSFTGGADGGDPIAGLTIDRTTKMLYGTTNRGGSGTVGTAFKMALGQPASFATIHAFGGNYDAYLPTTELIVDSSSNLYGTTGLGGDFDGGTIYEIAADGTESVLYSFTPVGGLQDGPAAALLAKGTAFYGTINAGGDNNKGAVFKFQP